jgi:hypothetical protein
MLEASNAPESHNGVGLGMRALFGFGLMPDTCVEVLQDIVDFRWGRSIRYVTQKNKDDAAGAIPSFAANLLSRGIPRTDSRISFEPGSYGTVVTIDISIWISSFGMTEIARPLAADSLLRALSRLKRIIEDTEPKSFKPWMFFNHRRRDVPFASDRVFAAIEREFGTAATFRDIDAMQGGTSFPQEISRCIESCPVFICIIGEHWMAELRRRSGKDEGKDWVAKEIGMALGEAGKIVLPILIGLTEMPSSDCLPDPIKKLSSQHAVVVRRDPDFEKDIQRLLDYLWKIKRTHGTYQG